MPKSPHRQNSYHSVKVLDDKSFAELTEAAKNSPRLRSHLNLHESLDEPFQRMVVGMEPDSYIRPHRHLLTPKPESLVCLRGSISVVLFDDSGEAQAVHRLSLDGATRGVDIPPGVWHTIISNESGSVFLESKPGPYVPFEPDDFASWAPEDDADYVERLRRVASSE